MPDDPAVIAEGLSEAQRRCVKSGNLPARQWATVDALRRKGLIRVRVCHPDGNGLSWTDLGRAVRRAIGGEGE
jgi:hypothetical protein